MASRRQPSPAKRSIYTIESRLIPCIILASACCLLTSHTRVVLALFEEYCFIPCYNGYSGDELVPGTDCSHFQVCVEGEIKNRVSCGEGLKFDVENGYCNFQDSVNCVDPQCTPTLHPTTAPTVSPSASPTKKPTKNPSSSPTTSPTDSPSGTLRVVVVEC